MSADSYWTAEEQAWILPVLSELTASGAVDSASDWPAMRPTITERLGEYGAADRADALVQPIEDAVASGADFKEMIAQVTPAFSPAQEIPPDAAAPPSAVADAEAFAGELPNAEDIATQLVTGIGADLRELLAQHPEFADVSDEELIAWVTQDVDGALGELADQGWEVSS